MNPLIVLAIFVWLMASFMLFSCFAHIKPSDRKVTKQLWFRSLMVIGGPVTVVVAAIAGLLLIAWEWLLEEFPGGTSQTLKKFTAKSE